MVRGREQLPRRDGVAAEIEAIVESDTDTLAGAVSRNDVSCPELEAVCQEAETGAVEIDEGVLSLVRIVTPLLTQHGECPEDPTS